MLLNPNLFIMALSWANLKTLGFLLPDWGLIVTVPISTNPNPKAINPWYATAFLSNPAAIPIGLGKFRLHTFELRIESSGSLFFLKLEKNFIARRCATTGGIKFNIGNIIL